VAHAAEDLEMKAIAVYTDSGTTARLISKYRPKAAVFGFAAHHPVCARMNLMWGVEPIGCDVAKVAEEMVAQAESLMLKKHAVQPGDVIAIVAGTGTTTGSTNFMRLHVVGSSQNSRSGDRAIRSLSKTPKRSEGSL
jgi:pyruvate kinase